MKTLNFDMSFVANKSKAHASNMKWVQKGWREIYNKKNIARRERTARRRAIDSEMEGAEVGMITVPLEKEKKKEKERVKKKVKVREEPGC